MLAASRTLNRLELVTETMRAALEALAVAVPQWLTALSPREWFDRYERRVDAFQLSVGDAARTEYALTIGSDGFALLTAVYSQDAPGWLRELAAVDVLRRIWVQHYSVQDGEVLWRQDKRLPPAGADPLPFFDPEDRASVKRGPRWTGYKVHLTETCEPDAPHVITHVATTESTTTDVEATADVHVRLDERGLLPDMHLVDTGYTSADLLVSAQRDFGLELLGPDHLPTTSQANVGSRPPGRTPAAAGSAAGAGRPRRSAAGPRPGPGPSARRSADRPRTSTAADQPTQRPRALSRSCWSSVHLP
ncbi:hypothetical protein [Streptomyces sp. V1I1]|uniref:hypothetical protein n=1 Tax=Streptomyces sp. V1I1 TaxID=3042272 RepID=UPI00277E5E80|nr:hypothetical protein [Streptomyces sp. V1I1]MDQ0938409.1 hypothetical protein [Streptomyces sp. V1I1]